MRSKKGAIIIFIVSFFLLIISLKLFWNQVIFVDEANVSPTQVNGGEFWVSMDWVRIGLLALLCLVSGMGMFKKDVKSFK